MISPLMQTKRDKRYLVLPVEVFYFLELIFKRIYIIEKGKRGYPPRQHKYFNCLSTTRHSNSLLGKTDQRSGNIFFVFMLNSELNCCRLPSKNCLKLQKYFAMF